MRQLDFTKILSHLRRDVVQVQFGVNFLLRFSRDERFSFQGGEAIFVQRVTHLQRALAQSDVVRLRSSEVLHGCAEGLWRQKADIDLHAATQVEADLVVAARNDIHNGRIFGHIINRLLPSRLRTARLACNQNVQIADSIPASAQ